MNNIFFVVMFILNFELVFEDIFEVECDVIVLWYELFFEVCEKVVLEVMDLKLLILFLLGGFCKRICSGMNYKDMGVFVENENLDGNDVLRKMRKCIRVRVG